MATTIAQLGDIEDGIVIPSISGTVKIVWDHQQKTGTKGDYTQQAFILKDGEVETRVTVWDHPDLSDLKGKHITLNASKGPKGWNGVQKTSYNGTAQLKVSKTGRIIDTAASKAPTPVARPADDDLPDTQPAPAPRAAAPAAAPAPAGGNLNVGYVFNKLANTYLHALEAACYVRRTAEAELGVALTDEDFRACAASLFIEANKQGVGKEVQGGAFHKKASAPAAAPAKAAAAPAKSAPRVNPVDPETGEGADDPDCPF